MHVDKNFTKKFKALAKKRGVTRITNLSAKEFRKLAGADKPTKIRSMSSSEYNQYQLSLENKAKIRTFVYTYSIEEIQGGYIISLKGRHYSENSINSFSFKEKLAHKKAIHLAAKLFWMSKESHKINPACFAKALVGYQFYNPKSRDWDNGFSKTIKHFQDTFALDRGLSREKEVRLIEDDKRGCLKPFLLENPEIISSEYKILAYMFDGWDKEVSTSSYI